MNEKWIAVVISEGYHNGQMLMRDAFATCEHISDAEIFASAGEAMAAAADYTRQTDLLFAPQEICE